LVKRTIILLNFRKILVFYRMSNLETGKATSEGTTISK